VSAPTNHHENSHARTRDTRVDVSVHLDYAARHSCELSIQLTSRFFERMLDVARPLDGTEDPHFWHRPYFSGPYKNVDIRRTPADELI
jgi:hypothetical protein